MSLGGRKNGDAISMKLALTDRERRILKRFMYRLVDELQCDRNLYRVRCPEDPQFGRLVRDGHDITLQTERDDRDARMFISRL